MNCFGFSYFNPQIGGNEWLTTNTCAACTISSDINSEHVSKTGVTTTIVFSAKVDIVALFVHGDFSAEQPFVSSLVVEISGNKVDDTVDAGRVLPDLFTFV